MLVEKAAHRDWIRSLSFAGQTLVTGSGDRSVRVWNVSKNTFTHVKTIDARSRVRAVAVSSDADLIVAAGEDATLRAFATAGRVNECAAPESVDWIRTVALRSDGAVIAGCEDGSVRLWNGDGLAVLGYGSNTTWSAAFTGDHAVLGRADGTIELRDIANGDLIRTIDGGEGRVWSLASSAGFLAAACGDGSVRLWSMSGHRPLHLNQEERRTWAVALNQAGSLLAASSSGGRVRVWELPSGRLLWERRAHLGRIRSMAFDSSGELLLTGGGEGIARLWRFPQGEQVAEIVRTGSWIRAVALDASGSRVCLGFGPGDIYIYDLAKGKGLAEMRGHNGRVLMIGFTANPNSLISAAADGTVRLWSLSSQKQVAEVRVDGSLQAAAFEAPSGVVLAASAIGTVAARVPDLTGDN